MPAERVLGCYNRVFYIPFRLIALSIEGPVGRPQ